MNDITLAIETKPIPLKSDKNGTVRVAGTRVTLDTIVAAFNEGATAEEIVYQYSLLLPIGGDPMECPNGCAVPMEQMKVERLLHKKGEAIIIQSLTMNVCPECGQESMPLKSARTVEDILKGELEPIGQFTAEMYQSA